MSQPADERSRPRATVLVASDSSIFLDNVSDGCSRRPMHLVARDSRRRPSDRFQNSALRPGSSNRN